MLGRRRREVGPEDTKKAVLTTDGCDTENHKAWCELQSQTGIREGIGRGRRQDQGQGDVAECDAERAKGTGHWWAKLE